VLPPVPELGLQREFLAHRNEAHDVTRFGT
jgi:hypothetical protein